MATTATPSPLPILLRADPFDYLPIEVNQRIALFILGDDDLCSFRLAYRATHDAVDADKATFWRKRFLSAYERPLRGDWTGPLGNLKLKKAYQTRREVLRRGVEFTTGERGDERRCLEVLMGLAVDAFSENTHNDKVAYESLNFTALHDFLTSYPSLLHIFKPIRQPRLLTRQRNRDNAQLEPCDTLKALQIIFAPLLLNFNDMIHPEDVYGYPDSQRAVYATAATLPIFLNNHTVNLDYVLHNINFWKYHLLRVSESTLHGPFTDLDDTERPKCWDSPLGGAGAGGKVTLGKHWKGSYAFVDRTDMDTMRAAGDEYEHIQDVFAGEDTGGAAFQDLCLQLTGEDEAFAWPEEFERHLRSVSMPDTRIVTRAQRRKVQQVPTNVRPQAFHFDGDGKDVSEQFCASGWLNPLPEQCGIPGWQRLTMMKYFENEVGGIDMDGLWAYEGVVLPGGQVVVGRWWSPAVDVMAGEEMYSGPFLLWCVDGPKVKKEDVEMESV